jgi:YVTN family beta-propeller protein
MKPFAQVFSASVARGSAGMCAAFVIASAHIAGAGTNVWTSHGPPGGTVLALAIDPSKPTTLYAGTFGAVFKSTDASATWGQSRTGLPDGWVRALAVDSSTPGTLYAATDGGVFKSTDGAATWRAAGGRLGSVGALVIDPSTPGTLYARTDGGFVKSTNGGASWRAIGLMNVDALVIDPSTPGTIFARGRGFFKSTDGGATFTGASTGLPDTFVPSLSIDPLIPTTLYAGTSRGVFNSTDAGATWRPTGLGDAGDVSDLVIDPRTPSTLYAGTGGGVFKSTDAGMTWDALPVPLVGSLAVDPITPTTLYIYRWGGGDGVFKSTDAGATWRATGLTITFIAALAIDPRSPITLYAGTGGGVFKSTDAAATWDAANQGLPEPVTALAIDPITPETLYAGASTGVFKSTDAGASWDPAGAGQPQYVSALAIDPVTPRTLYAGTLYAGTYGYTVFKSTDAAATWTAAQLPFTRPAGSARSGGPYFFVTTLAIDASTRDTLYAGTNDSGVFKSTDSGTTWVAADAGLPPPPTCVSILAIDPSVSGTVYAASGSIGCVGYSAGNGVFRSTNAGATWSAANTGLANSDVSALAVDASTPSTLYAGTRGGGVFKSTDGGTTWTAFNAGLTNFSVTSIAIDPINSGALHAGTYGGGVFSIQQSSCTGDCSGDGTVTVDEVIMGVNIALDALPLDACRAFDAGVDGGVAIAELIAAVNNSLVGCPRERTEILSGTLFVTDSIANKVYTLDAATGNILASADTEEHPVGVEKANGKVYVANEAAGTISVYDSATLSPITAIAACAQPHHSAVSPDGSRFYASCLGTNKVAMVDTETDTLVGLLTSGTPGARTHQQWPTQDGQRMWVANWETNDITEIVHLGGGHPSPRYCLAHRSDAACRVRLRLACGPTAGDRRSGHRSRDGSCVLPDPQRCVGARGALRARSSVKHLVTSMVFS